MSEILGFVPFLVALIGGTVFIIWRKTEDCRYHRSQRRLAACNTPVSATQNNVPRSQPDAENMERNHNSLRDIEAPQVELPESVNHDVDGVDVMDPPFNPDSMETHLNRAVSHLLFCQGNISSETHCSLSSDYSGRQWYFVRRLWIRAVGACGRRGLHNLLRRL